MRPITFFGSMVLFVKAMWEICKGQTGTAFSWTVAGVMTLGFFMYLYHIDLVRQEKRERRFK